MPDPSSKLFRNGAPTLQALIFDLDGVIANTEPLHERANRRVFAHYELRVPDAAFASFKGRTEQDVFTEVADAYGDGAVDADELFARKREVIAELLKEVEPVPGALAFIRQAAARYRLGLTTSALRENQRRIFEQFELQPYFDVVVTAEAVERPKPDPQPYRLTAERLAVAPEACLVIEDSVHGVQSALQAGCRVAALTTTFRAEVLAEAGAHLVVSRFEALARELEL